MSSFRDDISNSRRRRAAAIWLTIGLSTTIAVLTLIPLDVSERGVLGNDKIHHMLAFTVLTLPCAALYPKALPRTMLAAALYGGAIEIIQPYVGRSREAADFMADLMGIGIGATLGLLFHRVVTIRLSRRPVGI